MATRCLLVVLLLTAWAFQPASSLAKDPSAPGPQRYIVTLDQPPLVQRLVSIERSLGLQREASVLRDSDGRFDFQSDRARDELQQLDQEFDALLKRVEGETGLDLDPQERLRIASNAFVVDLTADEAQRLAAAGGIFSVTPDQPMKLDTDAGPRWIGAERLWQGEGGLPENRGEGIVAGIIDSGINWDHPSFADPGEGGGPGFDHENPRGGQLGLCSEAEVLCNDKLIGVYDYVRDLASTAFEENFNSGRDDGDHGAHVAATVAGNPVVYQLVGEPVTVSGVAPNAHIISYRICHRDDPDDPDRGTCQSSWALLAIDQAVLDGVDVINYSIGSNTPRDPWVDDVARAYLNALEAGIFVATSAGNAGPGRSTVGSPANAPWISAVGATTHDRLIGGELIALEGGSTTPPTGLFGATATTEDLVNREIVYAGDFGNAFCGTGPAELQPSCSGNSGSTNPFPPGTFNGEIVVCDRGTYGRVEKGRNVALAGAAGYVLINKEGGLTGITADEHCLPAVHLDVADGEALLDWLDSGDGHRGTLTGQELLSDPDVADRVAGFSSRGPNAFPAQDVLKPDISAPGVAILAADNVSNDIVPKQGTSMASPHVAGAAALLLAARPDLTPAEVRSQLMLSTRKTDLKDSDGGQASVFDVGSGRVDVFEAVNQALVLEETPAAFRAAEPRRGGSPRDLNLASLSNAECGSRCSFTRRVTALESGGQWTAEAVGLPSGASVTVSPSSFTLAAGQTQTLDIEVSLAGVPAATWTEAEIVLRNPEHPPAALTLAVRTEPVPLPDEFVIQSSESSGFEIFEVGSLPAFSGAFYETGGLAVPELERFDLPEDPSPVTAFDEDEGVGRKLLEVPAGSLLLDIRTLASEARDVELFVGIDRNGDGVAQRSEVICERTGPSEREFCEEAFPEPGTWWILVQNRDDGASGSGNAVRSIPLQTTVVEGAASANLVATGPGIVPDDAAFDLRLSWTDVDAEPGTELLGVVLFYPDGADGFPIVARTVRFERTGTPTLAPLPLLSGNDASFLLPAGARHEGLFIDVPPGVTSLSVTASASDTAQNGQLTLDLVPVPFDEAFANAPGVTAIDGRTAAASASGGSNGVQLTVDGGVTPGRWHLAVRNGSGAAASVRVQAELADDGTSLALPGGLWEPASRPGIRQGFEYTLAGGNRAFVWYTFDEDGSPAWYIASGPEASGNRWTANLLRITNDGAAQAAVVVGTVGVSMLDEDDAIFSWTLFGVSGSDRMSALLRTCPEAVTPSQNYSGLWYRGTDGLGGATIFVTRRDQAHIHYLFDASGDPRWMLASGLFEDESLTVNQFEGFCPTCTGSTDLQAIGAILVTYDDNGSGNWTMDFNFDDPLSGSFQRSDDIVRLTDELSCPE
jgi:subtilisin family serine protease